jgi:NAD+ kinase
VRSVTLPWKGILLAIPKLANVSAAEIPPPTRVGITYRENHEGAAAAAHTAREMVQALGGQAYTLEEVMDGEKVDCLLALGGDGTLLHAARLMSADHVPVMGINFGRVGYLCTVSEGQMEKALHCLFEGQYVVEERAMIRASVYNRREEVWRVDALNEVLIGGSNRTLALEIAVNDEPIGEIVGDGVIVATRTGSTAYAMSAGGPVVLLESMILVASNAISSALLAPTVLPMDTRISVHNRTKVTRPYVIADGQKDYQILDGTVIRMMRSPCSVRLIDPRLVSPYGKITRSSLLRQD